jgi:hypothetical protein
VALEIDRGSDMEHYRIQWMDGPRLVGGDTWVIDLDLLISNGGPVFRFAKKLQVIATTDELEQVAGSAVDWTFWRALVAVAVGIVIRRVSTDDLHLERPRAPMQLAPDLAEAAARAGLMADAPVLEAEVVSEFAAG